MTHNSFTVFADFDMDAVPGSPLRFSLPYRPTWRGISCPDLEVATCWSTSHTCQCNGYDHWGSQVSHESGDMKERGKKREMGEG